MDPPALPQGPSDTTRQRPFLVPDFHPSSTAIHIKRQFSADFRRTQNRRLSPIVALNSGFGQTKSPENRSSRAFEDGAPGKIRTPDPQIRSLVLYPAELPVPDVASRGR